MLVISTAECPGKLLINVKYQLIYKLWPYAVGVSNGLIQFERARKIWRFSNCSEKLDECSLARKIFASARILRSSLKFPAVYRKHNLHLENKKLTLQAMFSVWETLGKHVHTMTSGKMLPRFVDVYWNWLAWVQSETYL